MDLDNKAKLFFLYGFPFVNVMGQSIKGAKRYYIIIFEVKIMSPSFLLSKILCLPPYLIINLNSFLSSYLCLFLSISRMYL